MTKICTKCKKELGSLEFYPTRNKCKYCIKEYKFNYYIKNKLKYKIKSQKKYKANKQKYKEKHANYYKLHSDEIKSIVNIYNAKHKEHIRQYKKIWNQKYKEQRRLNRKLSKSQTWRKTNKYYNWTKIIYKNANHTCQKCGALGKMNAHHIKPAKDYPELRYDVSNGICLCVECHRKEHRST